MNAPKKPFIDKGIHYIMIPNEIANVGIGEYFSVWNLQKQDPKWKIDYSVVERIFTLVFEDKAQEAIELAEKTSPLEKYYIFANLTNVTTWSQTPLTFKFDEYIWPLVARDWSLHKLPRSKKVANLHDFIIENHLYEIKKAKQS